MKQEKPFRVTTFLASLSSLPRRQSGGIGAKGWAERIADPWHFWKLSIIFVYY